jgi:hypothetical protein
VVFVVGVGSVWVGYQGRSQQVLIETKKSATISDNSTPPYLERRRLQRGAHDMVLVVEGGHPDNGAAGVVAPVGGEEAREGGDEVEAAVVVHLLRELG